MRLPSDPELNLPLVNNNLVAEYIKLNILCGNVLLITVERRPPFRSRQLCSCRPLHALGMLLF